MKNTKKLLIALSVLLVLAMVIGFSFWKLGDFQALPEEDVTLPTDIVAQAPSEEATEPTEEPTDVLVEFPTQEPTEEETIYDPRPHPADVEKEQDRLNQEQDRAEQEATRPRPTEPSTEAPTEAPTEVPTEAPTEPPTEAPTEPPTEAPTEAETKPSGSYYNTKDEVALYIHLYGCLPDNYITKSQAKSLYGGTKYIPSNMNIGGDRFYNKEGLLPDGYTYYECDIGTTGGRNRGAKRIVFTTSGIVYYTDDHYQSFTRLY